MSPETVVLKFGLRAHYITHADIARQQRTEGRKTNDDNKLEETT